MQKTIQTQIDNTTPVELDGSTVDHRFRDFEIWVRDVRYPAFASAEKPRRFVSQNRQAMAQYQLAQIGNKRWAIRMLMTYSTGDCEGQGSTWMSASGRQACVEKFYESADRFFSLEKSSPKQDQARLQMLELLAHRTNLFGMIEPSEVDDW